MSGEDEVPIDIGGRTYVVEFGTMQQVTYCLVCHTCNCNCSSGVTGYSIPLNLVQVQCCHGRKIPENVVFLSTTGRKCTCMYSIRYMDMHTLCVFVYMHMYTTCTVSHAYTF